MLTAFLAQTAGSVIARGGDILAALQSPYFFYGLLDFRAEWPEGVEPPATPGNIGVVLELIGALAPQEPGEAARWLEKALSGLDGAATRLFEGDRANYLAAAEAMLAGIDDASVRRIAEEIIKGTAGLGTTDADGVKLLAGDNVFIGGHGDDYLVSGEGSDLFVWSKGDGSDYIRDNAASTTDKDTLFLTDAKASDLSFERIGDNLIIKIAGTTEKITSEGFERRRRVFTRGRSKKFYAPPNHQKRAVTHAA